MSESIPDQVRYDLPPEERERIAQQIADLLAEREEVVFAYLHGSFAEGLPFRDIDIAVYLQDGKIPQDKRLRWCFRLADEIQARVRLPVDVQALNDAPLGFKHSVTNGRVLFSRHTVCRGNPLWLPTNIEQPHLTSLRKPSP
ncbi:MAG: nucleotidyltransferase domain-containing protein [Chthonomonadetes bacterium]|nr:nucleotidyltransferase domain-containing protein [Chthonomonadetes bacterium]